MFNMRAKPFCVFLTVVLYIKMDIAGHTSCSHMNGIKTNTLLLAVFRKVI